MTDTPNDVDLAALTQALEATAEIDDLLEQMLEIAAIVEEALAPLGVHPVVVGGLALAYWVPPGLYLTSDIDVVMPTLPEAEERLAELGFDREGRYWTLAGRDVFFEAPGSYLEPTRDGFDVVQTRSGREVRVQAPEYVFALRLGEFLGSAHRDVFQELLLLAGSTELDFDALVAKAEDRDFLAELAVTRRSYLKGLEFVKETAENIQAGGEVPTMGELHEAVERLNS